MQNTDIGNIIRMLRLENQMTQKDLADKMHISDKTISKWERNVGYPDISLLSELSEILNLDLKKLLDGTIASNDFVGGTMKNTNYMICPICQNISICTGHAEVYCCGRKVHESIPQKATDEHTIVLEEIEDEWHLTSSHPMFKDHYISFVAYVTGDHIQIFKTYPEWDLNIRLPKIKFGKLLWNCTQHGLHYQYIK